MSDVSAPSVTLIEKLSLLELPEGLTPNKLAVSYVEVNELDGQDIGQQQTMDVPLNVSFKELLRSGFLQHINLGSLHFDVISLNPTFTHY